MDKKGIVNILSEVLMPNNFKKKGKYWVQSEEEVTKMVYLQKSQYGESYQVIYGYILKSIPLNSLTFHVYFSLGSKIQAEQMRINKLLDLKSLVSDEDRTEELKQILNTILVQKIQIVKTEKDVLNSLMKLPNLNSVPLSVKKYFNIE